MHRNRLKGIHSQAQKNILAEAQQRQEAALSGRLGVSDDPETDEDVGGASAAAGDQRGSFHIWRADGETDGSMCEEIRPGQEAGVAA